MPSETFNEKAKKLFEEKKFQEIIDLLTDENLEKEQNEDLYIWRGNAWYQLKNYNKAILDYNDAIRINKKSETGYYNKGLAQVAIGQFQDAIKTCNEVLKYNPQSDPAYLYRGSIYRSVKNYDSAIEDYTNAINLAPDYANAYYTRGLAYYQRGLSKGEIDDLLESKNDFEQYLDKTFDEDEDFWRIFVNEYIKEIDDITNNKELLEIIQLINGIKNKLLVESELVSHYTSLTTIQNLIIENKKFRISEGHFMNDPSEGETFYKFLDIQSNTIDKSFSPKPFIGSFVVAHKSDDLDMWRFYGKENGKEAKGCSITLETKEFIEKIRNNFSNELKERRLENESDINFYRVIYIDSTSNEILLSDSLIENELKEMMGKLKEKSKSVKNKITLLKKYLNSIAFLFKSDSFRSENELRLVVEGFEFTKEFNTNIAPPRVYVELESIKNIVKKLTLGPNVENANEWETAIFYSYSDNTPEILKSNLRYK